MFFPHPVLGAAERPYGNDSSYMLTGRDRWLEDGIELTLEHQLSNCPDLLELIQKQDAMYSTELSLAGQNQHFRRVVSGFSPIMPVLVPYWVSGEAAQLSIVGRIVARRNFSFNPVQVIELFRGEYELNPGTILAVHEAECMITPPADSPLITVLQSQDDRMYIDYLSDEKIRWTLPKGSFTELLEIQNAGFIKSPQVQAVQHAILVEAISVLRSDEHRQLPWMVRVKELASRKIPDVDILDENVPLVEVAERLFDGPIEKGISAFHLQIRRSSTAEVES